MFGSAMAELLLRHTCELSFRTSFCTLHLKRDGRDPEVDCGAELSCWKIAKALTDNRTSHMAVKSPSRTDDCKRFAPE
jgi:hypothetical protein